MWLCNNNSELATLPWEKTGLGKIYKDIHSVVVSSWLNVHQFPIHDQPVRRAVIIATWIHDSISCVFHNDNQNIFPFQIVFRLKMNELRNFNSTNGFWHCVQPQGSKLRGAEGQNAPKLSANAPRLLNLGAKFCYPIQPDICFEA